MAVEFIDVPIMIFCSSLLLGTVALLTWEQNVRWRFMANLIVLGYLV